MLSLNGWNKYISEKIYSSEDLVDVKDMASNYKYLMVQILISEVKTQLLTKNDQK